MATDGAWRDSSPQDKTIAGHGKAWCRGTCCVGSHGNAAQTLHLPCLWNIQGRWLQGQKQWVLSSPGGLRPTVHGSLVRS